MKNFLKNNLAIVLAFSLPVVLIVAVALSTYLPSLLLSTNYNFLYASCGYDVNSFSRRCDTFLQNRYSVVEGSLVVNELDPLQDSDNDGTMDIDENYTSRIFIHDTENNESREISLEEAETLSLNKLLTSPDGVTVSSQFDRGADFFIFYGGRSSHGYYLTKGNSRSELNLISNQDRFYYRDNFQFIGWVLPGRE